MSDQPTQPHLPQPDPNATREGQSTEPYLPGDTPAAGPSAPAGSRYRVLRSHAKGGLGEVFVAEDTELHRRVALKEIQPRHADHQRARGRFVLEAEVTGQLEHPGIVPVYGLGAYADGRPYYAMRFIKGESLQEAINRFHAAETPDRDPSERRLAFRELLGRFVAVCNAVAYAHAMGVIHRDLKPANVMLGKFGETLVVDWGLAKTLDVGEAGDPEERVRPASAGDVEATRAGSVAGTPAYMPPEQAEGRVDELGPAADVYSLGGVLHAALTGKPPVTGRDTNEVLSRVRSGDFAPPLRVNPGVPKALDAVCRKAMAKQPGDRYASAKALAGDVEAWLADEPVAAYREPWSARARRWARRHRTLVTSSAAGLVVAVALLSGAAVLLTAAYENERSAKRAAEASADAEREAKEEERRAKLAAEKRLGQIEKANDILASIFKDLNPRAEEKGGPSLREQLGKRLDLATVQLDAEAVGEPLAVARLQGALGNSQRELGYADKAVPLLEKSLRTRTGRLGPDHPDTLMSMNDLAAGYHAAGRQDLSLPLWEECLRLRKANFGADHPDTLMSMNDLALGYEDAGKLDLALPLKEECLRLTTARLGPDHPDTFATMNNLAAGYRAAGKPGLALPLYEECLRLRKANFGPDHPATLVSLNGLAEFYRDAGQLDLALPMLEECLRLRGAKLGPEHPETLNSMNNLAEGYHDAGRLNLALPLKEECLRLRKARLGPDHPSTLVSMNNLAAGYADAGKPELALPLYEECLRLRKSKLGPDHPDTLATMNNLGAGYRAAGKLELALPLYEESLRLRKAKLGPDHPGTLNSMNNLASAYQAAGKLDLALPMLVECLRLIMAKLGPDHPGTLTVMNNLASGYRAAGKPELALPLYEKCLGLRKAKLGPDHPHTLVTMNGLALTYLEAGRSEQARPLWRDYVDAQRKTIGAEDPRFAGSVASIALEMLKHRQYADAEPLLRECLAVREKKEPDVWTTFDTKSMLGGSLLGQEKYVEAEPLLRAGYDGMKQKSAQMQPQDKVRLTEALERLVRLYEATGKPSEAATWRTELYADAEPAPPPRQVGP